MEKESDSDVIERIGLSRRSYNVLRRANVRRISQLVAMSDVELLEIQQMGPTILAEIRSKTQQYQARLNVDSSSSTEESDDGIETARTTNPPEFLYDIPLSVLGLSLRPYNALMRQGLTTLGAMLVVREFHRKGSVAIRNLGGKSMAELEQKLAEYLGDRANDLLTTNRVVKVAQPVDDLKERWQELQRNLNQEISLERLCGNVILDSRTLDAWLNRDIVLQGEAHSLEKVLAYKTICDELVELFEGATSDRVEMFTYRFGFKRRTLEELGDKRKITRERVRQIVKRIETTINERLLIKPCFRIQSALAIAEEMGSEIVFSDWVRRISASGLLGKWDAETAVNIPPNLSPADLMIAVCNLQHSKSVLDCYKLPENLRLVLGHKKLSATIIKVINDTPKETIRAIHRQARNGGAVHVPSTAKELALNDEETRVVISSWGYKRISDDWYMLRPQKRGQKNHHLRAVFYNVLKMLKFCGSLELKDVCGGLRKHVSRGGYLVPPPSILAQVLTAHGFQLRDGYVSWQHENPSTASSSEEVVLREIDRNGPIVSHFELVQAFAQSELSLPALSVTLRYSPLFTKVETGLYKLRGKNITQGDIERTQKRQPLTDADPEVEFDLSGSICFRVNLGSMAITSGVIYTAHILNLTGSWASFADGDSCGTVKIRDNQIWGLMKTFRAIKVNLGDRIELRFNTWERTVNVAKVSNENQ